MEKTYNPQQLEKRWYQAWETAGYFSPNGATDAYCIMLPPPNVTGTLHMGHGFQVSLMDALIRYQRMQGKSTLWQAGTDHAGIATQMVVERQLAKENLHRRDLGRDAFVERVWDWKGQSDGTIKKQLRRMGASLDWTREKFTLDEDINDAVLEVFETLYDEGLIYRGKRLVNWDPSLLTAISDLEVVSTEASGFLWHLRYPVVNSDESLIVATTRPETMLGDTAVAVHPDDERYQHLIGKQIRLPLTDRVIPIISDDQVDPAFGTGCVKITPAHDFNDYAMGQRHGLEMINIFTPTAHMNENTPEAYRGMARFEAREKIIQDLKTQGLLEKIVPHTLQIPQGERSGVTIEPYLTDQWYVKAAVLAKPAIEAVERGEIKFVPENWRKTYDQWLENIEDWCISRQLWWGHRIPAWYDASGKVYVGKTAALVREKYQLSDDFALTQDEDVLDTWFSAALWPFVTLGWPNQTTELEKFYPTNVLVTGFDILFFWVARMVMMGIKFTGKVPFNTVYVTGLIRDSEGKKMSKSKGNVLDPIDLVDGIDLESLIQKRTYGMMQNNVQEIEKTTRRDYPQGIQAFGTDALRFTYCALANTGRDIRFDMGRIEGYRNFCNKLWNAARYVLMNTESKTDFESGPCELSLPDRWIKSKLQETIQKSTEAFEQYRFDLLAQTVYEFAWNEYCDWYLELSKPVLTHPSTPPEKQRGTRHTLLYVLENLQRLIHPLMPFITEEIWHKVAPMLGIAGDSIMQQSYPKFDAAELDQKACDDIEWFKKIILTIRQIRGEMNIAPGKPLPILMHKGTELDRQRVQENNEFLKTLAKLETIEWLPENQTPPPSATGLVDQLELFIPMAGLIDQEQESARLQKEIAKLEKELEKTNLKLNNPNYCDKEPKDVVEKEKTRAEEMQAAIAKLQSKLTVFLTAV
ncbi:MAG: valS [Gammaproteobacteria bacterium]|nr:valS [Gammaproteobacteria bacterium]